MKLHENGKEFVGNCGNFVEFRRICSPVTTIMTVYVTESKLRPMGLAARAVGDEQLPRCALINPTDVSIPFDRDVRREIIDRLDLLRRDKSRGFDRFRTAFSGKSVMRVEKPSTYLHRVSLWPIQTSSKNDKKKKLREDVWGSLLWSWVLCCLEPRRRTTEEYRKRDTIVFCVNCTDAGRREVEETNGEWDATRKRIEKVLRNVKRPWWTRAEAICRQERRIRRRWSRGLYSNWG